jgi:hypothetical protein
LEQEYGLFQSFREEIKDLKEVSRLNYNESLMKVILEVSLEEGVLTVVVVVAVAIRKYYHNELTR